MDYNPEKDEGVCWTLTDAKLDNNLTICVHVYKYRVKRILRENV